MLGRDEGTKCGGQRGEDKGSERLLGGDAVVAVGVGGRTVGVTNKSKLSTSLLSDAQAYLRLLVSDTDPLK